jgi:hypothetical protein
MGGQSEIRLLISIACLPIGIDNEAIAEVSRL